MAPGGKAFIIFNFPPGVLFLERMRRSVICSAQGAKGSAWRAGLICVPSSVALCLAFVGRNRAR
jgi:hypothetical protein